MSDSGKTDDPWEPPLAGTEAEHLFAALDRLRTTFRWKADELDAAGLRARITSSALTLGGLLKHLARVEEQSSTVRLTGDPMGPPWVDLDRDWPFSSADDDSPEHLYALWDEAVERCRARFDRTLATGGLDQLVQAGRPGVGQFSFRRLVCDLIEEYGRHTGHADLLRESVDGRVGEDPPAGWRAKGAKPPG